MAKRDPEKTARNKAIDNLTERLKGLLPVVLAETGVSSVHSLHGLYGGKYATYIDIKNEVIYSPDHFVSLYLEGFKRKATSSRISADHANFELLQRSPTAKEYLYLFLKRTYLRNFDSLSKKRPRIEDSAIWIGANNANYGLLITPRFDPLQEQGENDKSEIRHFRPLYWSIGHVLETGLVIPGQDERINFGTVEQYLNFFVNVLVRRSGSSYEYKLAKLYRDYVLSHGEPHRVPLLIPEFRYEGLAPSHKYRLDFTIIDPVELTKIGFELSPWSSHGYLSKIRRLSQAEINKMAKDNFEREMRKHKDFFRKHAIVVLIYTDSDLQDIERVFSDIERYLQPHTRPRQLCFQIIQDILGPKSR